jgi:gamma-glutamyltranspeptidase / glutathione hydrolase
VRIRRSLGLFLLVAIFPLPAPIFGFHPVAARRGMVVSAEPLATDVGVQILKDGGNAVDAAVAVGLALAVTFPQAGNLGGGGFMLIRMASGESVVVDYREEAPGKASRNMYLNSHGDLIPEASTLGARSVGVPGTVAGLALAEEKYGKLGWARVVRPALGLARNGFPMSYSLSRLLRLERDRLDKYEETRNVFLKGGQLYEPGETFRQPDLARTLRRILQKGPDGFYRGPVADALVATMKKHDGLIGLDDLAQYRAKIRKPLEGQFRGFRILTVPSPSSGGVALVEMLNVLEPMDLGMPESFDSMRLVVEAMRRAYADRAAYQGDMDFVSVPVAGLTSKKYAAKLREEILGSKPDAPVRPGEPAAYESAHTTHYSVVDAAGNAVSNTYTLNEWFGSAVTVEGAGFILNDEMDDFAAKPGAPNMFGLVQGEANAIAPRKRPLSSMTPTIVLERSAPHAEGADSTAAAPPAPNPEWRVRLVLGSPGGGTIINTVLEVLLNVLAYKMDVERAVIAPRFHHQWMPDKLTVERWGFSADTLEKLRESGYKLEQRESIGECEAIAVDPATGWRMGAADPRGGGKAAGY